MNRSWFTLLPLALAVAGSVMMPPATASAAGQPLCTKDTQEVTDLATAVTNIGNALAATPPDATALSQLSGDLFNAVTAAQTAGCLPQLPSSPTSTPPTSPPTHAPARPQDATQCPADTVALLSASLETIKATTATPPSQTDILAAASDIATAVTSLNSDSCLPVTLPVPTVPTPPIPPVQPGS